MNFITSPLFVFLLLGAVATAAFMFEPSGLTGEWRELAKRYATERRPASIAFSGEHVELGLLGLTQIDAALDDEGLWIVINGTQAGKVRACLLIPWDCVRFRQDKQDKQYFQLRGKEPINFMVSRELGNALQRRSERFALEDAL